jgi:hypothetical protein
MQFTFTQEEITLVANGVQELPFKLAQPLLASIERQYREQQEPPTVQETPATEY